MRFFQSFFLIVSLLFLIIQRTYSSQDLADVYVGLGRLPAGTAQSLRSCGTPDKQVFHMQMVGGEEMVDGDLLRVDQFPRFLTPTHGGEFGFDGVTVLGDLDVLKFERYDSGQDSSITIEAWSRKATGFIAGRVVSVFRPVWPVEVLRAALVNQRWGVDRPYLFWGNIVSSNTTKQPLYLQLVPTNLPSSKVVRINENVQFSSHLVNLWIPDFGDARVQAGREKWALPELARMFYEHFVDSYDTLAIITQSRELIAELGFHRNVRNDVAGIGLELFDDTAQYGSSSVLQGIEVFSSPRWTENRTLLHQQAHQWTDYTGAWDAAGVVRRSEEDRIHTPLLTPGEVLAGAVLDGRRRVVTSQSGRTGEENYAIEQVFPTVQYNPLTLYRMGLLSSVSLPIYKVFNDQGQFGKKGLSVPAQGVEVSGKSIQLTAKDFIAADGVRNGPSVSPLRRAIIYVSRNGLASQSEMDAVNFFAARLGERKGVTSWDGYPSLFGATGGRLETSTDVIPRVVQKVEQGQTVSYFSVAPDILTGIKFDDLVPGRIPVGHMIQLDGSLTLTDRNDYNVVCFRFIRYGSSNLNEIFVCSSLIEKRFSVPLTFTSNQQGTYTIEAFAFWSDSGPQLARSRYGTIVVGD